MGDITEVDDPPAPAKQRRTIRWGWIAAAAAAGAVLAGAGALAAPGIMHGRPIAGTPTPNAGAVVAAAQERKAAADAALAAREAEFLRSLELQVLFSMLDFFKDPNNNPLGWDIHVSDVGLVKTGENTFEGMATMTANDGPPKSIPVHVTADERNMMWSTDPGALLPLFR